MMWVKSFSVIVPQLWNSYERLTPPIKKKGFQDPPVPPSFLLKSFYCKNYYFGQFFEFDFIVNFFKKHIRKRLGIANF